MAREINGTLYRIRGYSGVPHYVECENLYDLYCYIAENWMMKGYPISSINRMDADGTTPKVAVLTNKDFKRILSKYQNFAYATQQLMKFNYYVEFTITNHARVYYKDKSGDFTELSPCDETRHGYITIEGKVQNIDEWLNRRV